MVSDPSSASILPRTISGYCIDPRGEVQVFGEGEKISIDAICTTEFDGECKSYKDFGLTRVVQVHYVDGAGSAGSIAVDLSRFATADGAYAMFTKRVLAGGDPAEARPRPLDAGTVGMIATGRAYVYKGPFLAELRYRNDDESPEQSRKSSDRVLSLLAQEIGDRLAAPRGLPEPISKLPVEDAVPLGIAYGPKEVLGIAGTGPAAVGFYRHGKKRYRMVVIVRGDADQAKDALKAFGRVKEAVRQKGAGEDGYRFFLRNAAGAKLEWLVARAGKMVAAIGDEGLAVQASMSEPERIEVVLSREDKLAKLRTLLSSAGRAPSAPASAPR